MTGNRAERRRTERNQRRVLVGENVVVSETGQMQSAGDTHGTMPDKEPGVHRWVAVASYHVVDPGRAGLKYLDSENMLYVGIGCYDCETPWSTDTAAQTCAAGDTWTP